MPYVLNGEPLAYDEDVEIDGFAYSYGTLTIMSAEDREALGVTWVEPEPVAPTVEELCALIDAERDRRQALDFAYDFGDVVAVLDDDTQERAGVRSLQMGERNKRDWLGQHARATAKATADPNAIIFIRASDNANLLVPAWMWIAAFEEGADRDERLMAFGGRLKTQQRAAYPVIIDRMEGWPS